MINLKVLRNLQAFKNLAHSLSENSSLPNLGLPRAARLSVLSALYEELNRPMLLITDRADHALTLFEELSLWLPEANRMFFPEPTALFYEDSPWGITTRKDRLAALTSLSGYQIPGIPRPDVPPLIVAPARAIMTRTIPRRDFVKATKQNKPGQNIQPDELTRTWVSLGYEPTSIVTAPGQFARRGGLLDIWPAADSAPIRLEFFGDEIDTLRTFDPQSQRTYQTVNRLTIAPAREYIQGEQPELPSDDEQVTEFHIPLLHPTPSSILDYLPSQSLVFIDDIEALADSIQSVEEQAVDLRHDAIKNGNLQKNFPIPYLTWSEISDSLAAHQHVSLGPYAAVEPEMTSELRNYFTPGPRFGGRLKVFFEYTIDLIHSGDQVVTISRQASRLTDLWTQQSPRDLRADPSASNPVFIKESLSEGWILRQDDPGAPKLHLLTDGEIFGWQRPQPRKRTRPVAQSPEAPYTDLEIGDWVVHVDHGIGVFMGLVNRTIEGIENEYFCIEYAEGDQLYVPVYQADRLTQYIGPDSRTPNITRLGGVEWRNSKARVKEAVAEVADDLLELYATRHIVEGHAFPADTVWQQELEASFPYIETEDQLRVLDEVKQDMQSPRPMDRLICGDVGYGKTEIALRAAFKAVLDGKQVLMLVPTTVLAQQHYFTFRERLAAFPMSVEMLSRFRSPQEQTGIIKGLSAGSIDIVIGTHRLFSADVIVKDLGLLIIDEEQRFGVTHKEKLKQLRKEVDVLTLTATPIPRTLYMALTGVRDISTLNTPPAERLPVITHVGAYSPRVVRQAILREIERGGQVFFVHNRVNTIHGMQQHLKKMIPEAKIAIAHGQMHESELSRRMEEFSSGKIDVLLCTSIIESGLDIPNANTLIVDRADTFGLAQLYQLRGRVGRGAQRAYAYFFRHNRIPPTSEGRMRLETIAENTQLGSGFSIAMRDLEIRGAGDLLGTRQHGHIAAVGFHLYTRLLAEAVKKLHPKGELPERLVSQVAELPSAMDVQRPMINVDLPLATSIPQEYVADKNIRLRLYRRIADVRRLEEIERLADEFLDRFGPLPKTVESLLYQLKIRLLAEKAGVTSISTENNLISIKFPPLPEGLSQRNFPQFSADVRIGKNALWVDYKQPEEWHHRLEQILGILSAWRIGLQQARPQATNG